MTDQAKSASLEILSKNKLLNQLEPAEMEALLAQARIEQFRDRQYIFEKGDPGDSLYAILEGRVGIGTVSAEGKEIFLNIMEPGDVLGEIALLDGKDRTASAMAMQWTTLLRIDRADFLPFLKRRPELCLRMMEVLCERLRWTSDIIEDTIFLEIPDRLAKRLLTLTREYGRVTGDGIRLDIKLSQESLAQMLGATRESVNKGLRSLQAKQAIRYEEGHIVILNTNVLQQIAER